MAKYRTSMWRKTVEIAGNFADASSPVVGVGGGLQVADFRHSPLEAMRAALKEFAASCGEDLYDHNVLDDIDRAPEKIVEDDDTSHV